MNKELQFLEHIAYTMRMNVLTMTSLAGSGHPTSSLSAADLVAALFFHTMQYDPHDYNNLNNDRFILSKGHASPVLYAAWKEAGVISDEELMTYRQLSSVLEGHPTMRFPYTEAATGSLGIGLSIGVGMALHAKREKLVYKTYVLLGDGEIAEGSVWEAAEIASFYKLNNLIAIVDCNRLGQSAEVMHDHHVHRYEEKFAAFGWKTFVVDGHNMQQIVDVLDRAQTLDHIPVAIIAKTFKGYGLTSIQDKQGFHGKAFKKEELNDLFAELDKNFPHAVTFDSKSFTGKPHMPAAAQEKTGCEAIAFHQPTFQSGDLIATRKAYGMALREAGARCHQVVALDGDVKNSTYAQFFEEKYPERFFQCFIAEQNMIGMAVGMEKRGDIPFVSTFGAFMTRAHDQIRMAAIGQAKLRLVGSHAGISIGEDGPSQMALEDIALMRALPGSVVLYPSDAVSTWKLVEQMTNYQDGISYLRTTRMETQVIYDNNETFEIGGCKVLRQSENDVACIVAAGVTLHEALKAYELLQEQGISVSVIDLYSVKPLDRVTVATIAKKSRNKLITVEDHYREGGFGEAVASALCNAGLSINIRAVERLPRSGRPAELLAWAEIDAAALVKIVIQVTTK
jgi:transketolase